MQCGQWRSNADHCAVRISDYKSFSKPAILFLRLYKTDMLVIDLRNKQRHVLVHAIAGRIADDGITGTRKCLFGLAGNRRRQARKDDIAIEWRLDRLYGYLADRFRDRSRQLPGTRFDIRLSSRPVRCSKRRYLKLRMILK